MKIKINTKLLLITTTLLTSISADIYAQNKQDLKETKSKYEDLERKTNVREGYHDVYYAEGVINKIKTQEEIIKLPTIETVEGVFGDKVKVMYGFSFTDKLMFTVYINNSLPIDIPLTSANVNISDMNGDNYWLGLNHFFGFDGSMMKLKNGWQILNVPIEKPKKHMSHKAKTFRPSEISEFKYNFQIQIKDEILPNNSPEELTDIFSSAVRMNSMRNILYYKHPKCGDDDYSKEELQRAVYSPEPIPDHAVSVRDFTLSHKYKVEPEKQLEITYFNTHKKGGQTIPIGEYGDKWYFITCRK